MGALTLPELESLREAAPVAYDRLLDGLALADDAVSPDWVAPMKERVAALLGEEDGGTDWETAGTPLQQAIAALTEQFVIYVAGVGDEQWQPLEESLSIEELHELVKVLYAVDMGYRVRLVQRSLFGSGSGPLEPLPARVPAEGRTMDASLKEVWRQATILADEVVDPETIEYLRLRCAWYHNCHT